MTALLVLTAWIALLVTCIVTGCRIRLTPHQQPPGGIPFVATPAGRPQTAADASRPRTEASAAPHQDVA